MPSPRYYDPAPSTASDAPPLQVDLCIYGANAAGVLAAVQARRLGLSVALLNPAQAVGGLTTGGLSYTDVGNKAAIGGLAREFYQRLGAHYGKDFEWCFEPHVAERVLNEFLAEVRITALHGQYVSTLTREPALDGTFRIRELVTTSRLRVRAKYFIDCSYEGDLLARAGVSFFIGREANATHDESFNGQQLHATHQFSRRVDPYTVPGVPTSGLIAGIDPDAAFTPGAGDNRLPAYNFRVCMTRRPDLRVPFPKPTGYDRAQYELLARYCAADAIEDPLTKFDRIQGDKTDTNNHGAFSTDYIGASWSWPESGYAQREKLFQAHVTYQQGYHWFLANDPVVPGRIRSNYAQWGLASDEFIATDHWPHQLYVREARRLVAAITMTEHHCFGQVAEPDVVALGAYGMDSHNCRRFVLNGAVVNEGDVQIRLPRPYGISYRAITPRRSECANLVVPVCASATHVAYGSLRMEPVFMILAQSAALAVALSLRAQEAAVQDVSYPELRAELLKARQLLAWDHTQPLLVTGNQPLT